MDGEKNGENPADESPRKKPYHRPQILYREPLEAMAALCVPRPPAKANPGQCPAGPIAS